MTDILGQPIKAVDRNILDGFDDIEREEPEQLDPLAHRELEEKKVPKELTEIELTLSSSFWFSFFREAIFLAYTSSDDVVITGFCA